MLIVLIIDSVAGITVAPGKKKEPNELLLSDGAGDEWAGSLLPSLLPDHGRPRLALLGSISAAVINICGPSGGLPCHE